MPRSMRCGVVLCLLPLRLALAVDDPAAPLGKTAVGATLSGKINVPEGQPRPETVVFLEPVDASVHFPPPSRAVIVSQRGARFAPPLTVVCVGQAVDFVNDETSAVEHNVFSQSPTKTFDLGLYGPGVTKSVTFDKPGVVRLHCSIHRNMDGAVYVTPTPFYAIVGADGRYSIEGVPAGEFTLRTWQRRQHYVEIEKRVTVAADAPQTVDLEMARK